MSKEFATLASRVKIPEAFITIRSACDDAATWHIPFDYAADSLGRISAESRGLLLLIDPSRPVRVHAGFRNPVMPGIPRTPDQELAVRALCKLGVLNIEDPFFRAHGLSLMSGETTAGRVLELAGTEPAK